MKLTPAEIVAGMPHDRFNNYEPGKGYRCDSSCVRCQLETALPAYLELLVRTALREVFDAVTFKRLPAPAEKVIARADQIWKEQA